MMKNTKLMAMMSAAALVAAIGVTGCGAQKPAATDTATTAETSAPAETKTETTEQTKKEAPAAETKSDASATKSDANATKTNATSSTQNQYIGEEAARDAALAKAGLSAADVTELNVELDLDDAVVHYDVDFKSGGKEYDADVDATTGDIITFNAEVDD